MRNLLVLTYPSTGRANVVHLCTNSEYKFDTIKTAVRYAKKYTDHFDTNWKKETVYETDYVSYRLNPKPQEEAIQLLKSLS